MIPMLLFAIFQAVEGPAPTPAAEPPRLRVARSLLRYDDYPVEASRRGQVGIVSVALHVSPDGTVSSCDVSESGGSDALDTETCRLLKSRARFDPAKDANGSVIASDYRMATSWGLDERQPTTAIAGALKVSRLPLDYKGPAKTQVMFDETGRVSECVVTMTSGSIAIDKLVCGYIRKEFVIPAPKSGSSGVRAAAIRYATISLSADGAKSMAK